MPLRSLLPIMLCCLFALPTRADIDEQRQAFEQAMELSAYPNSPKLHSLLLQLKDYPLTPYIEQAILLDAPYLANRDRIDRFLATYADTPLAPPLRQKWLTYLKRQKQDALFLTYFNHSSDTELYCHALNIRWQQGEQDTVLALVDELWLTGDSLPKSCDPVLTHWKKAGRLNETRVYERLVLAADGGNHTLIPYLKKSLPADKQYLADLWYAVRRSPDKVSKTSRFPNKYPEQETEILTYGLTRLAWRDRDLAIKSWQQLKDKFPFTDAQQQEISQRFAIALTLANHDKAGEWLARANQDYSDSDILHWHLTHLIRLQQWSKVVALLEAAGAHHQEDLSANYWLARSYELLDAPEQATEGYQQLAAKRHYYGFLASGRINTSPTLADAPLQYDATQLAQIANLPATQRAYELLQLGRYTQARREWLTMLNRLNEEQKIMAAVIADSWNWHDQAIHTFSKAGYMDDVKRRFPLAYKEQLLSSAEQNQVEPAWAFAIARRESSFMQDANSGVGARGLMQLMPGTARYIAKQKISLSSLYDPQTNVQYGTQYMKYLMDKLENNQVLATAAYNAGWRRVKQWLPEGQNMPADIWVETIPYKETREYVKAVMAYKQIYLRLLGKDQNLFSELANMEIQPADD